VNGIDVMLLVFALVLVLVIAVARRRGERGEGLRFTLADRTDPREPVLYLMGCGRAIGTAMFGELTPPRPPEIDPFVFPQVTPLPQQIRRADAYRGDF
jgi:hypothetical protein